jgi:hypothetical protein
MPSGNFEDLLSLPFDELHTKPPLQYILSEKNSDSHLFLSDLSQEIGGCHYLFVPPPTDFLRPWRFHWEGCCYHISSRGNEQKEIFRKKKGRPHFLGSLSEMPERFRMRLLFTI